LPPTPELRRLVPVAALCSLLAVLLAPAQVTRRQRPVTRTPAASEIARQVLPSVVLIAMEGGCFGSGFFVTASEILTNKHVVTCSGVGRGSVRIVGAPRPYPTKVIVADEDLDVALIEAEGLTAPPLQLDTSRRISVGEDIYVVGNPEGLEGTFTRGIVSGVRAEGGLLQLDAPISPGSSGGPVVDAYGKVVGVTVASLKEGQNLNFAVPASLLADRLDRMRRMLARAKTSAPPATSEKRPTSAPAKAPLNAARRTWEAHHDWGDFVSDVLADLAVRDEIKALLDSGLDINTRDRGGRTALHLAATLGQAELARYLLSRGADSNATDNLGRTPLMLAVGPGDMRLPDGDSLAPLGDFWSAPPCGRDDASEVSTRETSWPAWYSVAERRRPVIDLLLASGADPLIADKLGRTAFDHAAEGGLTGYERLLHVSGKAGLPPACNVTLANSPALIGLRLGMSASEVSARLGGLRPTPGRCGLSTLSVSGNRLSALGKNFEGVASLSLVLLDGKVSYVNVTYGRELPFASFDEYLASLSSTLGLPKAWRRAAGYPGVDRAYAVTCDGFVAAAGHMTYSYVELHDTEAVKTLVRRDVEEAQGRRQAGRREQ
jgi:ankyrin repeat protein